MATALIFIVACYQGKRLDVLVLDRMYDEAETVPFSRAIRQLPRATETEVAFKNSYSGEGVSTDRFNAVVEPGQLMTASDDEQALYNVPTDSYSIINPTDVYGPLEEVLWETEVEGTPLADLVFGDTR